VKLYVKHTKTVTMITKTLFSLVILAANISVFLSDELDESEDIKLLSLDDREDENADSRTTFALNSVNDVIKGLNFVSNGINYYLSFPTYTHRYIGINDTAIAYPLLYSVTGAALVAYVSFYLIGQIPLPEFGLGRSDPELGFGLQRDLSEYSEEYYDGIDDTFTYEYPDSFFGSASEKKEKKFKLIKGKRKLHRRSGPYQEAKQFSGKGFFERIVSAFNGLFTPIKRSAADTLSGGFEERLKRYEDYWKNRRRSANRRLSKQGRSEDKEIPKTEEKERLIGPQIPKSIEQTFESQDSGGGHKFYRDRVKEVYKPFYN